MRALTIHLDVPDLRSGKPATGTTRRRVVGLLPDAMTVAVATKDPTGTIAEAELTFTLAEARAMAEAALTGDPRALTRPGLARVLAATAATLFSVAMAAGAIEAVSQGGDGDGNARHPGDREEAGGDGGSRD